MPKKWTMIRVQAETHRRLRELAERMERDHQAGRVELPDDQAEHVSLDYLLTVLMDRDDSHRQRARASAARKKGQGGD